MGPSLGKNVYVSPLFCNSEWFYNITYKSYIVMSGNIQITPEIYFIDIELVQRSLTCPMSPLSFNSPIILSPLSDQVEPYRDEIRRRNKLKKKLEKLENNLEDKDSEIQKKSKEISKIKKELKEL